MDEIRVLLLCRPDECGDGLLQIQGALLLRHDEPYPLMDQLAQQLEDLIGLDREVLANDVLDLVVQSDVSHTLLQRYK